MYSKIKPAVASFMARISQRILHMAIEAEIEDAGKAVEADAAAALKGAVADVEAVVAKVEALIEPAAAVQAAVVASPAPAATVAPAVAAAAPAVAVSAVDPVITKIKGLLAIAEVAAADYDKAASFAKSIEDTDVARFTVKLKAALDFAGIDASRIWADAVAMAT